MAGSGYHICSPQHRRCCVAKYLVHGEKGAQGTACSPKTCSCSSSCTWAPRGRVPAGTGRWGWSRDAPAPSCTSLSCPVTWPCWGLGLWGQHVPLPGGVPALHPLHPVAACGAACREGLRLCLGESSFGAGGEGRLSAALPDAPAVATQTKPSRSAEPLGHPQLLKSAFHFPNLPALNLTLSSDVFGWQLTRSAGGSSAGGGCAAPSLPHRAHQNWRNRSKKGQK